MERAGWREGRARNKEHKRLKRKSKSERGLWRRREHILYTDNTWRSEETRKL